MSEFEVKEAAPKPSKPMSIEAYTKALQKDYEIAKLRSGIAKCIYDENQAMFDLDQLKRKALQQMSEDLANSPQEGETSGDSVEPSAG